MKNTILKNGIIAGLITTGWVLFACLAFDFDLRYGELLGYSSMILAFSTIYIAIKKEKEANENQMTFAKALKIGLGITLVASAIYVIGWLIMSDTIAQDFMAEYYQQSIEKLKDSGMSETELNEKIAEMEHFRELYKNPIAKIGITLLEIFPVGLLISLVSALILRTKSTTA